MQFNTIYYLHIPKTGGRWILRNINPYIEHYLNSYNLGYLNNLSNLKVNNNTHWGWRPQIDDQTLVYTSIREPASHICSIFSHRYVTNSLKLINAPINEIKEVMFNFLEENKSKCANIQARNICYYDDMGITDYGLGLPSADLNFSIEKIKRINKVFLIEKDKKMKQEKCIQEIVNLIDKKVIVDKNFLKNINLYDNGPISKISNMVYNYLSVDEKEQLNNFSPIDYELYLYVKENKNV